MLTPSESPNEPEAWYGSLQYLLNISIIGSFTSLSIFLLLNLGRNSLNPSAAFSKLVSVWHASVVSITGPDAAQFLLIEGGSSLILLPVVVLSLFFILPVNLYLGSVPIFDKFTTTTVSHIPDGSPLLWIHFLFTIALTAFLHFGKKVRFAESVTVMAPGGWKIINKNWTASRPFLFLWIHLVFTLVVAFLHFGINTLEERLRVTRFRDEGGNATVMVQGVPKTLGFDRTPLVEYFEHLYPEKVYRVIVPMDLCALDDLATELVTVRENISKLVAKIESRGVFEFGDGYSGANDSGGMLGKLRLFWGRVVDLWDQIRSDLVFTDEDRLRKLQELRADLETEMAAYKEGRAKGAGVAFVVFKDVYTANKAVQDLRYERKKRFGKFFSVMELQLQRNHWKVERAPLATDIYWNHLGSSKLSLKTRRVFVNSCLLLMLLFFSSPLAVISAVTSAGRVINAEAMDSAKMWLTWIQSSSWLATIIFQFLPNVLIFVSMYIIVPSALSYLSKFEKHVTVSGEQRAALVKMVCFFLVNLILLRALVESSLESLILRMGHCYLDGEDCERIEQYMSASYLSKSCLSSLAFLITSTFLGISFDLLAPIPWIKNKLQKYRKNDMLQLVPEQTENSGSESLGLENQDLDNLRRPLISDGDFQTEGNGNGLPPGATLSEIDLPGQALSEFPVSRTSPVPKQTFDFAQYYAFNLTIFALTLIYSAFAPVVVPVGAIYFGYRYLVDKYNFLFVYRVRGFPTGNDGRIMDTVLGIMRFCVDLFLVAMLLFFSVKGDSTKLQAIFTLVLLVVYKLLPLPSENDSNQPALLQGTRSVDNVVDGPTDYELFSKPRFEWDSI